MQRRQTARVVAVPSCMPGCANSEPGLVFEMFVCLANGGQLNRVLAPGQSYRARRLLKGVEIWSGRILGEGEAWILQSDDDDDPIWFIKFGTLRPGEYITLYPPGRTELVCLIVNVDYPFNGQGTPSLGTIVPILQPD